MFKLNTIPAILVALTFLVTGFKGFTNLQKYQNMISGKGFPLAGILATLVVSLKAFGGLSIVTDNYYSHDFAKLLALFTFIATIVFHNFFVDKNQLMAGLRNLGIIGGLLLLIQVETGKSKSNIIGKLLSSF